MDSARNKNYGRRGRGRGIGRGGGGRGDNQSPTNQSGGRGSEVLHRGPRPQSPAQQEWVHRTSVQGNQPPVQQAWGSRSQQMRPPQQSHQLGVGAPAGRAAWGSRSQQMRPTQQSHQLGVGAPAGRASAWTGRPWGPSPSTPSRPPSTPTQPSPDQLGIQKLKISESKFVPSTSEGQESQIQPIRRPDQGGTLAIRSIRLLVNHFPVKFDPNQTIIHYDVDVKPLLSNGNRPVQNKLRKSGMRLIRDKLFSDSPQLKRIQTGYDGEKNIFSAVPLPAAEFKVDISEGEDVKAGCYLITIKFVNELKLSKLNDYITGNLAYIPRDVLQGMDLVMKENPSRRRISIGRSFYSKDRGDDLSRGLAAYRGFQQSLKPTSQGLALCLDYSVLAFRKPLPVMDFLREHIPGFRANDFPRFRQEVNRAVQGLQVRVIHRVTKQKFTIAGLTNENACDIYFDLVDPEGNTPPERTGLLKYFKDKWNRDIEYKNIPCLELGKSNKSNNVPIEFCVLVEGQRYPKEHLDKHVGLVLKNLSLAKPIDRKKTIDEMVKADDGPCGGAVTGDFGIGVDKNMTKVVGRVIGAPQLKVGASYTVTVDGEKCQWNLVGKALVDGKRVERWALLDFTESDRYNGLQVEAFVNNLMGRCRSLGMQMEVPLVYHITRMQEFSSVDRLEKHLQYVLRESSKVAEGKLQLIVCAMTRRDNGYKYLKWVSETRVGVVTQCCLSSMANKGQDQYLANLCLKINAKLGGSNFELTHKLLHLDDKDHVMFVGADVNHPAPKNTSCPSIAAVVGTINWPAANRYAARVCPQAHRKENIIDFGSMCLDLVNTYACLNKFRPRRIVVFRDGVSEGQFEMALGKELYDLKKAFSEIDYHPLITLVVAQKRHQSRLFVENGRDGGRSGNVPPGTVVDTVIVHPHDFDFYLCSHYGGLGTSKPTHYYVLWDENSFTSDLMQKLIYDMCFTFARCTKPVSLVPPVYYADLVAYRGRLFQETVMESQPSRHASTSSSPSAGDSFDPGAYTLHDNLENIMFFI